MSVSQTVRKRSLEQEPSGRKQQRISIDSALLHCIPPNIVPLVQPPFHESNFFTDLEKNDNPRVLQQTANIVAKYPPPPPPPLPDQALQTSGGIMVPFIYPPPPVIEPESPESPPRRRFRDTDTKTYVELPPLPFPPPNYMPHPLISDKSSLAPEEVIESLLEALKNLPRINMVVASAAGSLIDLKHQASEEGLTIEQFEDGTAFDYADSDDESLEDYMNYAANIDTSEKFDLFDRKRPIRSTIEVNSDAYANLSKVSSHISSIGRAKSGKPPLLPQQPVDTFNDSDSQIAQPIPYISHPSKDIVISNGMNKERRRTDLAKSAQQLQSFETRHRLEIYEHRRLQLIERLQSLKASKILFTNESTLYNEDLKGMQRQLEFQRDFEILRLKISQIYQLSNNMQFYYENCDRAYKKYNSVMLNKLKKLQNFFQFQHDKFSLLISSQSSDMFDIKTRDSGKLYTGISQRDFSAEIKQRDSLSAKAPPLIHDFMPLTSLTEFDIITGDGPSKLKQSNLSTKEAKSANIQHKIFQSSLYDPITSSSDTNTSELSLSLPPTPKRRGRRAATTLGADKLELFDKNSKHSEAALIARIMKNFVGPQGGKADELTDDFDQMGIDTKWPI